MSRSRLVNTLSDQSVSFRKDAPRPPVPGEEGKTSPCQQPNTSTIKSQRSKPMSISTNPRRNENGLGEPEGSASPDSPLARWTKSLHSLLGDQDGAYLFRTFLEREKCVDTLDFWFACNGFRQMALKDTKTPRVAKAIFKRYIENHGIVAKQLKPATKAYIKEIVKKQLIDSVMFDHAQSEIQTVMEGNAYQLFLTSDIYLEYVRNSCENTAYFNYIGPESLKVDTGYLPTLNEEEEWSCVDLKNINLPSVVGLSSKTLRVTASLRAKETADNSYRSYKRNHPVNPYHINLGYAFAPATSANESEISSDALTDESMSLTDSSVDGIPPYRMGNKKQLQREMHRSVKANGQVSLPHFPRTYRMPREMTPIEPSVFAEELIARLEKVQQNQETMDNLEERLQQIKEEEETESSICSQPSCELSFIQHQPLVLLPSGSCEDDPQAILDDHLSRVLKTPGCQSPGACRHSPCPRSPDRPRALRPSLPLCRPVVPCSMLTKDFVTKQMTKHVHHHHIHHHTVPKSKEEIEAEAARWIQCFCSGSTDYCYYMKTKTHFKSLNMPLLHLEHEGSRTGTLSRRVCKMAEYAGEGGVETLVYQDPIEENMQTTLQQIVECESDRQNKHKPHRMQCTKKIRAFETIRTLSADRSTRFYTWATTKSRPRNLLPIHPLVQETATPLLTPQNTLAQLEEACRKLDEVSKPPKQSLKEPKRAQNISLSHSNDLMITYFFCGEEIPYRRMLKSHSLTLGHFKEQLSKKGNYRYYFKKASQDFDCGAVFEEIKEDDTILPTYEGRVLGKVERID